MKEIHLPKGLVALGYENSASTYTAHSPATNNNIARSLNMYHQAFRSHFINALSRAQSFSERIRNATTPVADLTFSPGDRCYLNPTETSGYCVKATGELVSVFSLVKGQGDALVESAIRNGATHLDCFDGYLPTLYARHGFVVSHRAVNWGGAHLPDVVYMVHGLSTRAQGL